MKKILLSTIMAIVIGTTDGLAAVSSGPSEDILGALYHEFDVWEDTRKRNDINGFVAYLVTYPNGNFKIPAQETLRRLRQQNTNESRLPESPSANEPREDQVAELPKTRPTDPTVLALQTYEHSMSLADLRQIQRDLQTMGHYSGAIDAVFGKGTRRSIRAYQDSQGNDKSGYLTQAEFQALREDEEKTHFLAQQTAGAETVATMETPALPEPAAQDRPESVIERMMREAEAGEASAQAQLSLSYYAGRGVPKDYKKAVYWAHKAAEQGDPRAQSNLGLLYINGHGVRRDLPEAARWWREAAQQGLSNAAYNLGVLYENGRGLSRDYSEAARWYKMAWAGGDAHAESRLNSLITRGLVRP